METRARELRSRAELRIQEKRKGSPLKLEKVQNGTPFVKGLPDGHPMGPLLSELSRLCKTHYDHTHPPSRNVCISMRAMNLTT